MPADMFPNGPADLAHAVAEEKCWLAISGPLLSPIIPLEKLISLRSQSGSYQPTHRGREFRERNLQWYIGRHSLHQRSAQRKCIVSKQAMFILCHPDIIFQSRHYSAQCKPCLYLTHLHMYSNSPSD